MNRVPFVLLFTGLVLGSYPASATPIALSAFREVRLGSDITGPILGASSPSTALGAFADSVLANLGDEDVSADQTSNIQSAGSFSGAGNANVGFSVQEFELVSAMSFFDVFFDITTPHAYSLAGTLSANADGGRALGAFGLDGPTPLSFAAFGFGTTPLTSNGVLAPGSYHLTVAALFDHGTSVEPDAFMGGSASFDFDFRIRELQQTPEPATVFLVALGMAAGLAIRKRS
jgi:hypothetical protein